MNIWPMRLLSAQKTQKYSRLCAREAASNDANPWYSDEVQRKE